MVHAPIPSNRQSRSDALGNKKGDDRKKVIAWLIRKKTSVRIEWITTRLKLGTTLNFSRYVRVVEESKKGSLMGAEMQNDDLGGLTPFNRRTDPF